MDGGKRKGGSPTYLRVVGRKKEHCNSMDGTGLRGRGRCPRRTRCSGGDLYVPHFETRLIRELRPKV